MDGGRVEVEIKAWVRNRDEVLAGLKDRYTFIRSFSKSDTYYRTPPGATADHIRIRREGTAIYLTFKEKSLSDFVEVNKEWEFELSDRSAAEALLLQLGCSPDYRKQKQGQAFSKGEITIELSDIQGLGCFLELEYLAQDRSLQTIEEARGHLLAILRDLEISESAIEPRFYLELLSGD